MMKYFFINFLLILFISQLWANVDTTKLNEYNRGFQLGQVVARNEFCYQYRYCLASTVGCCTGPFIPLFLYTIVAGETIMGLALSYAFYVPFIIPFITYVYWDRPKTNVRISNSEEYNDGYVDGYKNEFRKTKNKVVLTIIATELISASIITAMILTARR